MSTKRWMSSMAIAVAAALVLASAGFAQGSFTNSGTVTNNTGAVLNLKGSFTPGSTTTLSGIVKFTGGSQLIPGLQYDSLETAGAAYKSLDGNTTVAGAVTINDATLNVNGKVLTLSKASGTIVSVTTGSLKADSAATTKVVYSGDGAQTVFGTSYRQLALSSASARTKTADNNVVILDTLSNDANTTLDFATHAFTATGAAVQNAGGLKSSGTVTVDATAAIGGSFEYASGGAQTIAPATYTNLITSGAGAKTFTNGATYQVSGSYSVAGGARTYTGSTFEYVGSGAQTLAGESYDNLVLSGAGVKTLLTGTLSVNGTLNQTGGLFNVAGGTVDLGGVATFNNDVATAANFNVGAGGADFKGALTVSNGAFSVGSGQTATIEQAFTHSGGSLTFDAASTVVYNGSSAQNIVGATYGNLTLQNSAKTFTGNNAAVAGSLIAQTDVTITGVTLALNNHAQATFAANLVNNGTFNAANPGNIVTFSGAGAQAIGGSTGFTAKALVLNGSGSKTAAVNLTVDSAFVPTKGIKMSGSSLLALNSSATTNGVSYGAMEEVIGSMKITPAATGTYTLNNTDTKVTFGTAVPTDFTLKSDSSTAPTGYAADSYINRAYHASYTGWTAGTADLQLAYLNSEKGTAAENRLRQFKSSVSSANKLTGTVSRLAAGSSNFGYVKIAGLANGAFASGDELILSSLYATFATSTGVSNNWNDPLTWDENAIPGPTDEVEIAKDIVVGVTVGANSTAYAKSVVINNGFSLSLTQNDLVVNNGTGNAVTNNGGFIVNAGRTATVTGNFINAATGTLTNSGTITVQ